MWKGPKILNEEDSNLLNDLMQENSILRNEIAGLYTVLSDPETRRHTTNVVESQTELELVFDIPEVVEKLKELTLDLSSQKSLNTEQAQRAKEYERKIHACEVKILDMNMELVQLAQIKSNMSELERKNEKLLTKMSGTANEYLNLTVELNHQKGIIESLNKEISARDGEIAIFKDIVSSLQETITDLTQKANHAESQLQTAVDLNSEYQVKLHKDDITTVRRQAELNQWERKCESQSKEISRLVDQVRVLMSANENAEREIRILEAKAYPQKAQRDGHGSPSTQGEEFDIENCVCGEFMLFQSSSKEKTRATAVVTGSKSTTTTVVTEKTRATTVVTGSKTAATAVVTGSKSTNGKGTQSSPRECHVAAK